MSELPGYQNQFAPGTPNAYRNVHENELRFDYRKVQFKFKWHEGVEEEQQYPVKWFILFTPEDDSDTPENESQQIEIIGDPIEWPGDTDESPLFEIEPDSLKPGEDGSYRLLKVDLDIDSDNTNGAGAPDRSGAEEALEDDEEKPGKLIGVNNGDINFNNIPDYYDGYDGRALPGVEFTKLVVEMPENIEADNIVVKFNYSDSDPAEVTVVDQTTGPKNDGSDSSWTTRGGKIYELPDGNLRLWTKDGYQARSSASVVDAGDFVPSGVEIEWNDFVLSPGQNEVLLFVEGIRPDEFAGEQVVTLEFSLDTGEGMSSFFVADEVWMTVADVAFREYSGANLAVDLYSFGSGDYTHNSNYQNAASLPIIAIDSGGTLSVDCLTLPPEHGLMEQAISYFAGSRGNSSEPIAAATVSPEVSQEVDHSIAISSGGSEGFTVLDSIPGVSEEGPSVRSGMMGLAFLKKLQRTVGVRRINQRYPDNLSVNDFDAPEFTEEHRIALEDYLNDVYRQANVEWTVEIIPELNMDYDGADNGGIRDGKLGHTQASGYEYITIELHPGQDYSDYQYVVFLVEDIYDASGFADLGQKFSYVEMWNGEMKNMRTVAHEIGHCMNLPHPFESGDYDPENLMNYYDKSNPPSPLPNTLRFNQWNVINKLNDPDN